ncbi:MAG: hypothetical protein N2606_02405 [Candidatus Omnitrophica bacterium]|nr:hypothetical protein [Candidatus Omnitrophota bacterium]
MMTKYEVDKVENYIRQHIKLEPESEEFYYCHSSLCLLDAVYSVSSRYYPTVKNTIKRYCETYQIEKPYDRINRISQREDTVSDLVEHIDDEAGPEVFAEKVLKNQTKIHNILKSKIILNLADYFIRENIIYLNQFSKWACKVDPDLFVKENKIFGVGPTVVRYLAMLAGNEQFIKPDRHILNFLKQILERTLSPKEAEELLRQVAKNLNVTPRTLDNCIWRYQSNQLKNK